MFLLNKNKSLYFLVSYNNNNNNNNNNCRCCCKDCSNIPVNTGIEAVSLILLTWKIR